MRKLKSGDRVVLPAGTVVRNITTGNPSVWNSPGELGHDLSGTVRTAPPADGRWLGRGSWFRFEADPDSGTPPERVQFNRFLYPEQDFRLAEPDDEWVSVGHALPTLRPSDVGLPCSESDWVLIAVVGWDAPAVAQFWRWNDEDGGFDSAEWVLQGRDAYVVQSPVTHWRKLPALPNIPAPPR